MRPDRIFKKQYWLIFSVLLLTGFSSKRSCERQSEISGHSKINNLAFYIRRSVNENIIVYALNPDKKGELNVKEPLRIYWKNYATDSTEEPLNYIQKKYVYGVTVQLIDSVKRTFSLSFVSYPKKKIFLARSAAAGNYRAVCEVGHQLAALDRIYIQVDGGSFWFPKIRYVELSGTDLVSKEPVTEMIKP